MPERDTSASPDNRNELGRRPHPEVAGADAEYPIHPPLRGTAYLKTLTLPLD